QVRVMTMIKGLVGWRFFRHRINRVDLLRTIVVRMPHHQIPRSPTSRLRPRPLRTSILTGLGLPPAPRAFRHVDQLHEPRGRHARLNTDHVEVLEGPNRPSADFFHTRISTAASPNA